jgi:hypothetical protein
MATTPSAIPAALAVLLAVLVALLAAEGARRLSPPLRPAGRGAEKGGFTNWGSHWGPDLAAGYPYNYSLATADPARVAEHRLYSTAEVDPLLSGQLYAGPRAAGVGRRWIYGGRTSHGHDWGLREFSTGVPGQAGVDVGLLGMREYSLDGRPGVFDDGIPETWRFPSTPVNWYAPRERDYYDVEAQQGAVFKENLMTLQEPDHDPPLN